MPAQDTHIIKAPLAKTPINAIPQMEREICSGGMRFILLPPGKIELNFKPERSLIDVNLNPIEHHMAINSDKLEPRAVPADSLAFWPKSSDIKLVTENYMPGFVVEIDTDFWDHAISAVFADASNHGVEFLVYERDPVGADLGRAGIQLLVSEYRSKQKADALALESIGLGLITRIAKRLYEDRSLNLNEPESTAISKARLNRVAEYVESQLDQQITVTDLANIAALSVAHFSRAFKASMGVTPALFIGLRRIARAKQLLLRPELSIATVADLCGFSSQSHLTVAFKKHTAMTPRQYRLEARL
ncbi:MAG: AraC family transcriptional regulator [Pseudomonadota bacterium]